MSSLADLPTGHTFPPIEFTVDADASRAYRDATGDPLPIYAENGVVPPLAVAALALGALMKVIELPDGTLHGNESFEAHAPVPTGATLLTTPTVTRNATRAGTVFTSFEFAVEHGGKPVLTAKSTVLFPAATT